MFSNINKTYSLPLSIQYHYQHHNKMTTQKGTFNFSAILNTMTDTVSWFNSTLASSEGTVSSGEDLL